MDDLDYLAVDFDPNSLTVPRLRSILVAHDVSYPSSAKKPDLVNLFNDEIAPQAKKILSARSRTKRTSKGITNVEHDISAALPPDEGEQLRPLSVIREPGRRRKSPRPIVNQPDVVETTNAPKHARQPAQESISANVNKIDVHSVSQKQPRHKVTSDAHRQTLPPKPTEETLLRHARASDSPFSSDNPFQSGSSPLSNSGLVENEKRRQTTGVLEKSNKDAVFNRRRRTDDYTSDKQNRAARADHASLLRPTRQTQKLEDQDHGILSVGEEFTPEEEAELARDDGDISARLALTSTRSENARGTANVAKTAPWAVILAFILGFAAVWRQEKLDIGYCGVAQQLDLVRPVRIPEWASTLQPQCEPCPQHAFCYPGLKTLCEPGFVLKPHPLSVGGVVPLPPSCEPDTDRERRVHAVADRAIEYLREINAQWECGELRDESGKLLPSSAVKEEDLRREVSTKKRRDMTEAEFEELWNTAVGDIRGRDEVVVETEADSGTHILRSTSLARINLSCAIRRAVTETLARNFGQILVIAFVIVSAVYGKHSITTYMTTETQAKRLASITLRKLAQQPALNSYDPNLYPETWISIGQLRDDILREEFSANRRRQLWRRVQKKVEQNSNIRSTNRVGRSGEMSKAWEWIGAIGAISNSNTPSGAIADVDRSDAQLSTTRRGSGDAIRYTANWEESRPMF